MARVIFVTLDYFAHARAMWLEERLACPLVGRRFR